MKLEVTSQYSGKFGEVIEGTFDGVPFKAKANVVNRMVHLKEIETTYRNKADIATELKWCGYVD